MPTLETLLEQRRTLDAAIAAARKNAVKDATREIVDLLRQRDLPLDAVAAALTRKARSASAKPRKTKASVATGQPRYRDPDTGKTWTGHGRPPAWWHTGLRPIGPD